jgi:hypothetical protein
VDDAVRHRLIEALTSRNWTPVDAERAATRIAALYEREAGEWKVVLWEIAGGEQSVFLVARKVDGTSVFDSSMEGLSRDVATALNEIEAKA